MLSLMLVFIGSSLLLVFLSIPLMLGKVKPNWFYGFRTRRTVNNPEIWYPANAYSGRLLTMVGALTIVAALILRLVPDLTVDNYAVAVTAVLFISLTTALVMSFRYLASL